MLPNRPDVIKLSEDEPLRVHWDIGVLRDAYKIWVRSNYVHMPSPEEMDKLPTLWRRDLFRLDDEVRRQLSHIKANMPDG